MPVTMTPMDILAGTACTLVPGVTTWGPGFYLVADNDRVEAGPFPTQEMAERGAQWLDDQAQGTHPAPYSVRFSSAGLLVGSRIRRRLTAEHLRATA